MTTRKSVAILISGRGSNMAALLAAAAEKDYPAIVTCVISDDEAAPGLSVADNAGVTTYVVPRAPGMSKTDHESAIEAVLAEEKIEIVCLAGYMRLLSAGFTERWTGRVINIHPSLLPLFPGLETHTAALNAGVRLHGCTVHFVTAGMDEGPIIAQSAVPVIPADTETTLAARVLKAEHSLYPIALAMLANAQVTLRGGKVVFADDIGVNWGPSSILQSPALLEETASLEDLARRTP